MTQGGLADAETVFASREANPAAAFGVVPVASRYRADIDGLRALAVGAVILTHAGIAGFGGGFVGVDIFFVISGYLIYRDLMTRVAAGRFSLFGFYGRRLRRTLPALYVVGFVTLVAAAFVKMPGEFDEVGRSLAAAVLLVPNIFFFTQFSYFDFYANTKALLHTWSLGVEEQFYLIAPLVPLALRRFSPGARATTLALLFAVSLSGTLVLRPFAPTAAFYLMPPRIFEFLIGAAVAEGLFPTIRRQWVAEAVTVAALAALAGAIYLFSDDTPHPSWPVLVPSLATAAIIHVGTRRQTVVGRLLGLRVPAFVGLISYSLYLWHWPILVLSSAARVTPTPLALVIEAVLLLVLSVLTWRFVETPFRAPGSVWRAWAPWLIPLGAVSLLGCALGVVATRGLPQRFAPDVAAVAAFYDFRAHKPFREGRCFITSKDNPAAFDRGTCLAIAPDRPNVLLIGDSHGAHLWTGLRDTWPKINVLQATASGCKPVIGTTGASFCVRMMDEMLGSFIPQHHLDAVVIGGLWDDGDIAPLQRTISALRPHVGRIVVFGPMPRYGEPLATLLARAMARGEVETMSQYLVEGVDALDADMQKAIAPLATYVSPYQLICPGGKCRVFAAPRVPMQFDHHHLTPQGVDVLMALVRARDPQIFAPR